MQQPDMGEDEIFDFGKAKMEFFKQRARQILVEPTNQMEEEYLYDG